MYKQDRSQDSIYSACESEGSFIPLSRTDVEQVRSMVKIALIDFDSAKKWADNASRDSGQWNAIYKINYDVLHSLAEVFVMFEKVKAKTHECLFAYLCNKHPELGLDFGFFDKVRTKRNGSVYYGSPISYDDWNEVKLQLILYISAIRKAVEEKIKKQIQ